MIREIINFTKEVEDEVGDGNLELKEGFHAVIELDQNGNLKDYFSFMKRKGETIKDEQLTTLKNIESLSKIEKFSETLGNNKGIKDKKIFSNNFFTLYFKLFFSSNAEDKELLKKINKSFSEYKNESSNVNIIDFTLIREKFLTIFSQNINDSTIEIKDYFDKIKREYYPAEKIIGEKLNKKNYLKTLKTLLKNDKNLQRNLSLRKELSKIKLFCINNLKDILLNDENFYRKLILKDNKSKKELTTDLLDTEIRINFSLDFHKIKEASERYINDKLPLQNSYNEPYDGKTYSLPAFFNAVADKKPFLKHRTASFQMNGRYPLDDLKALMLFQNFKREKILPNPLPIFIDKRELNNNVIRILKKENTLKYSEIIKKIFEEYNEDLGNYYLLFFLGGEIKDFDFISSFRYNTNFEIKNIFSVYESKDNLKKDRIIKNIFQFELDIIQIIFNNSLVQISKKQEISLKYFDDIKKDYCDNNSAIIYQIILKYRKAIYDFIYKSKTQAITGTMFYDMMSSSILNDIQKDKRDESKRDRTFDIREKLNIWFSLNHHFDKENKNFGGIENMPSRITENLEKIKKVATIENEHLETDEEFAFSSGQLIYHLLTKNESSGRTHALLEPFLQKHDPNLFKMAIANTFEKYKHAFTLYPNKYEFDKIISEVMSYETEEKNMKNLLPFLLAGYFAKSVFTKEQKTNQGEFK